MRVAAVYDIHGNLPALEAVLREIGREDVDMMVVGGDVLPGPMPTECLECLRQVDVTTRFIMGNGESDILKQLQGAELKHIPQQFHDVIRWTGEQLTDEDRRHLATWEDHHTLDHPELGPIMFCHATPRNNTEIFTRNTADEVVTGMLADATAPLVICGHTHMQFDRTVDAVRVVNAGSVGMPFGRPGAYWLLLGPEVDLRHTAYDFEAAAARIRETSYPQADAFAADNVLAPPSETLMLERFTQAASS